MSVRAEPLEDTVREMLIAAVDHESVKTALDARNEPQDDGLLKAIRRDEESLETLSKDFYADQLISREEFLAARAELNRRLEGNRTRMASQTRASAVGKFAGESALLAASWDSSSLEWRRSIVSALLEHINVHARRGDVARVRGEKKQVRVWKLRREALEEWSN